MAIIDDWREKHPSKAGKGRLVFYVFLLVLIIFLILNAETYVRGFTRIFFSPDTSSTEEGSLPE